MEIENVQYGNYIVCKHKFIGKGQYGSVFQCYTVGEDQSKDSRMAAKILSQANGQQVDINLITRELQILQQLKNHPCQNLVIVYDVINSVQNREISIIMEKCEGGDLQKDMQRRTQLKNWYTVEEACEIITQIVKGYNAIHELKIIHRDIKPANILIQKNIFKLADFGMGRILQDVDKQNKLTKVGTPAYAAPQLFFDDTFSSKCDIFSVSHSKIIISFLKLGVIFYQLLYGCLPIPARSQQQLLMLLKKTKEEPIKCNENNMNGLSISPQITQLLESMLAYEESKRVDWNSLVKQKLSL